MELQFNNPDCLHIHVKRIGTDKNPVLIIDNVLANAEAVRDFALGSAFLPGTSRAYYPGYVSPCLPHGTLTIAKWVANYVWEKVYGLQTDSLWKTNFDSLDAGSFFGVFAPDPTAKYRNVHVDGHSWLAILIHLSEPSNGPTGTAFWRHKSTGLESIVLNDDALLVIQKLEEIFGLSILNKLKEAYLFTPESSYKNILASLKDEKMLASFPRDNHGPWELLERVEARFNRLVAYPTWQWHSVFYPGYKPDLDLRNVRVTFNTFVNYPCIALSNRVPVTNVTGLYTA